MLNIIGTYIFYIIFFFSLYRTTINYFYLLLFSQKFISLNNIYIHLHKKKFFLRWTFVQRRRDRLLQNFVHKKKINSQYKIRGWSSCWCVHFVFRLLVVPECSNEKGSSLELLKGDQSPNGGSVMNFPPGKDS